MTITKHLITADYENAVYDFIKHEEKLVRRVYSDPIGIPTLGVGYSLIVLAPKGSPTKYVIRDTLSADLTAIGITLSSADITKKKWGHSTFSGPLPSAAIRAAAGLPPTPGVQARRKVECPHFARPALYDQINTDGSLALYDPATGTGNLSNQYLKDRSAFLTNKILSGVGDKSAQSGDPLAIRNGSPLYFEDRGSTSTYGLYQGKNNAVSEIPFEEIAQVVFGHSGTDLIGGGDQADSLYGMAGDDTLQGKLGNDYLEGGQGTDTYIYTSNDGLDTILDTDGLGKIQFDGVDLNGGDKLIGDTYKSADGNYFYTILHNTGEQDSLLINAKGGTILIKDFQEEILLREAA